VLGAHACEAGAPLISTFISRALQVRDIVPKGKVKKSFELFFKGWNVLQNVTSKFKISLYNIESVMIAFEIRARGSAARKILRSLRHI
jgi:hypothetical protein